MNRAATILIRGFRVWPFRFGLAVKVFLLDGIYLQEPEMMGSGTRAAVLEAEARPRDSFLNKTYITHRRAAFKWLRNISTSC